MIGAYTCIKIELTAVEPFHIGTGAFDTLEREDGTVVERSLVQKAGGRAVIPGSSLKGALRALATRNIPGSQVEALFGPATISDAADSHAGKLICWTAKAGLTQPTTRARTSIAANTGAPEDHKLFHFELFPSGGSFQLRFGLQASEKVDTSAAFQTLLGLICASGGVTLGGGGNGGKGRMRGDIASLSVVHHALDGNGDEVRDDQTTVWQSAIARCALPETGFRQIRMRLECTEPYISVDTLAPPEKGSQNRLQPLKSGNDAVLTGDTIRGALRARAVWLERLGNADHRDNRDLIFNRDAAVSSSDLCATGAECNSITELTSTELLFGINGWKGLLAIREVENVEQGDWIVLKSVKLDRFSGAPINKALFETEAISSVTFSADLELDETRLKLVGDQGESISNLTTRLWANLRQSGVMLGHGVNRGFGWFDVKINE